MKIGIVVFSNTGHTLAVAQKLKVHLISLGHAAVVERLKPKGGYRPSQEKIDFAALPALDHYEALVFAGPVQAFSLCPPLKVYLGGIESLRGRKIACLLTQQLPFRWMGGNQAAAWMRKACLAKGGTVGGVGIVNWSRRDREAKITDVVRKLSLIF